MTPFAATRRPRRSASPPPRCPEPTEEDAAQVLRRAYYARIKNYADNIASEIERSKLDREAVFEMIRQETDDFLAIYATGSTEAIDEALDDGRIDPSSWAKNHGGVYWEQLAYPAVERDIVDSLHHNFNVDVNALD